MTGRILIKGLRAETRVGVTDKERARPQTVVVDVDIGADLDRAAEADDLGATVDYARAVTTIAEVVARSNVKLLERLAAEVVSVVSRMDGVRDVTVQISKQPSPVPEDVESIAVRMMGPGK